MKKKRETKKLEKSVKLRKRLYWGEKELGRGVVIKLLRATPPMIRWLRVRYMKDPKLLTRDSDIQFLFHHNGNGMTPEDHRSLWQSPD